MKSLIFVNGPMGVGKTTVCQKLLKRLKPGVYLDGDWCWHMEPFRVTDATRTMVMDNITAMLSRFLTCAELDYIIFGWVMHQPEIAQTILERLDLQNTAVYRYTLLCTETTLCSRLERDIQAGVRGKDIIERALGYLPLYDCQDTIKIVTDGLSPEDVARQIVPGEGSL